MKETALGMTREYTSLGLELLGELANDRNQFLSPLSIGVALSMLAPGARGETLSQLATFLVMTEPEEAVREIGELLATLGERRCRELTWDEETGSTSEVDRAVFKLTLANALFVQDRYPLQTEYVRCLEQRFSAALRSVDFGNAAAAAESVNHWVSEVTEGKIPDLVDAKSLDDATRLILVNAVYFLAGWRDEFHASATEVKPFRLLSGEVIEVPRMSGIRDGIGHTADHLRGFASVEIPYRAMAMVIILPEEGRFEETSRALDAKMLQSTFRSLRPTDVALELPKFELEVGLDLGDHLQSLGLTAPFAEGADFSGISPDPDGLIISRIIHRARIKVDEQGTEATAATAILMEAACALDDFPPPPIPFIVDRPFLFFIRDPESEAVLFAGRCVDPRGDRDPRVGTSPVNAREP